MKIAVTGATGFVGRHVLLELARHPVDVVAISRETSAANLGIVADTVQLDIGLSDDRAFDLIGRPDVLIHLAWGGLPNYRSLRHFEHELPMQYRFLSTLVRSGLSGLIVAGTCFEYGMQSGSLAETIETYPANPYALAKDTLRRELEYLRRSQPFALTWARLFYLYGEGQAQGSLLPQLKQAVEKGHKEFNMSGGEQLRDYLPVTDVAKNLVMLALHKADVGCLNICSGKPISVRTLVEGWVCENRWDIHLNRGHYPYPDYEPMAFWGDRKKWDGFVASL